MNSRRRSRSSHSKNKKKKNKLSDHFSKKDFICKESGEFKISLGLVGALELLRSKAKNRINIIKGFENLEVAEKRGKLKRNFHTQGLAADIQIDNLSINDAFLLAETIDEFKGIGLNFKENYLHVDTRKEAERLVWVEENDEDIELTDENRNHYIKDSSQADKKTKDTAPEPAKQEEKPAQS